MNPVERVIETHAEPVTSSGRYARRQTIPPGRSFDIDLGPGRTLSINADDLLP